MGDGCLANEVSDQAVLIYGTFELTTAVSATCCSTTDTHTFVGRSSNDQH